MQSLPYFVFRVRRNIQMVNCFPALSGSALFLVLTLQTPRYHVLYFSRKRRDIVFCGYLLKGEMFWFHYSVHILGAPLAAEAAGALSSPLPPAITNDANLENKSLNLAKSTFA
jgi:hypothetical protein